MLFSTDGNLQLWNNFSEIVWQSNTYIPESSVGFTEEGFLTIYSKYGNVVWSMSNNGNHLVLESTL